MLIREINVLDRPRERAEKYGISALSNSELLAILFRTGTREISALELGNKLLQKYSVSDMTTLSYNELIKISGIGPAKALSVLASFELFKRSSKTEKKKVISPKDVFGFLKQDLQYLKQENFIGIYLDTQNNIIDMKTIFIGTLSMSVVHPREVFNWAVRLSAASLIICHNHPSGDPTPSNSDIEVTAAIQKAGETMNICLVDHIIIGENRFVSLKEIGYL